MGVMGRGRRDKRNGLTGMRDHLHMSTSAIALEPRFMFDAAGVATAADAITHDPTADALFDTSVHSADQALLDAAAQSREPNANLDSTTQPPANEGIQGTGSVPEAQPTDATNQQTSALILAPLTGEPPVTENTRETTELVFVDSNVINYQ